MPEVLLIKIFSCRLTLYFLFLMLNSHMDTLDCPCVPGNFQRPMMQPERKILCALKAPGGGAVQIHCSI